MDNAPFLEDFEKPKTDTPQPADVPELEEEATVLDEHDAEDAPKKKKK